MEIAPPLSFTRDQLYQVLQGFVAFFKAPQTLVELKKLAPSEKKIADYIEQQQKNIFSSAGINPHHGMNDLRRASKLFKHDADIMQLLLYSQTKEDCLTSEAVGQPNELSLEQKEFLKRIEEAGPIQITLPPGYDKPERIKELEDPQKLQQFHGQMKEQFNQMDPQQQQQMALNMFKSLPPAMIPAFRQRLQAQIALAPPEQREMMQAQLSKAMQELGIDVDIRDSAAPPTLQTMGGMNFPPSKASSPPPASTPTPPSASPAAPPMMAPPGVLEMSKDAVIRPPGQTDPFSKR